MRPGSPPVSGASPEPDVSSAPSPVAKRAGVQPAPVIDDTLGNYRLVRRIGEGAMGTVYEAHHVQLGRAVAIKVLKPEHARQPNLVQRFFSEARAVNKVDHPHIVQVFDFHDETAQGGPVYFVMELLRGESLGERLARGPLPLADTLQILEQIAEAIAAAHRVQVVHRDLKPDNIFLCEGPRPFVKVLDFGVAKLVTDPSTGVTLEGMLIGTPTYMSPEQAASLETEPRTDVYALGALLYESLRGVPPFTERALGPLMVEIITRAPPAVGDVSATGEPIPIALQLLAAQCLAKTPEERPESMEAVLRVLRSDLSRRRGLPQRLVRALQRNARMALVAAVLLLSVGMGLELQRSGAVELPKQVRTVPEITVVIDSNPSGAMILRDDTGEPLGLTPFETRLPRGSTSLPVMISLEGFRPAHKQLPLERDVRVDVQLTPIPLPPSTTVPASTTIRRNRSPMSPRDAVLNPFTR